MKRILPILLALLLLCGCGAGRQSAQIVATTKPLAQFAAALADGTDLTVAALITEPVSCLHDYALSVAQIETAQNAELVLLSGAGLEDAAADALAGVVTVDCSAGLPLKTGEEGTDPHYWLDPALAAQAAANIAAALTTRYPQHAETFAVNLAALQGQFAALSAEMARQSFGGAGIVTFHDGFSYFADALGLTVLAAIETEPGSEVAAGDLTRIIALVRAQGLPCVFTEENGARDAAEIVAAETGCAIHTLTTCLSSDDYFAAMRQNIETVREALT